MDDNGNIIYYILLGVIYLLSRVFGKKKKQPAKPVRRQQRRPATQEEASPIEAPTAEKERDLSFEDIIRELSGIPQPKPQSDPTPRSQPTPALDVLDPEKDINPAPAIEGKPQPAYTVDEMDEIASEFNVPKPIGSYQVPEPDMAAIRRKDLKFKRDDKYRIRKKKTVNYLDVLREEGGPAKAFVMGEIFNRKY